MKKILTVLLLVTCYLNISAQEPQGGFGGGGRPEGGRPPMRGQMNEDQSTSIGIMKMPEIPDITLDQREKLSKALTDEQKTIMKLIDEKRELLVKNKPKETQLSEKDKKKLDEKLIKIDDKISSVKVKSEGKIRSILSPEQYEVFLQKKSEIEFTRSRPKDRQKPLSNGEQGSAIPRHGEQPPFDVTTMPEPISEF